MRHVSHNFLALMHVPHYQGFHNIGAARGLGLSISLGGKVYEIEPNDDGRSWRDADRWHDDDCSG